MSIAQNLTQIKSQLPAHVTLVAVSKTKPVSDLMEAYNAGQRIFGENKIQEMTEKWEQMPKDIEWHMIGHVQTNKVKFMAEYVKKLENIKIVGLMGMATFTENTAQIEKEFKHLKSVFDKLQTSNSQLQTLSMGMSGDYQLAISCGSTMVRIGSSIFGNRNYQ